MGCISKKVVVASTVIFWVGLANAIVPNKLVSGGLPAHTGAATTDYLTDGYLTNWKSSSAKEIALNVGEGPTKLRINWESYGDCAWATDFTSGCGHSGVALSNFKILTSANSTDGKDGDWVEAASVKNNPVMARGVDIEFAGKSWFKFVSEGDVGQILEIEAFDMSAGGTDTWFFMGTSISQMGIKQQDTDSTTAQIIHAKFPEYTPAMLRGGIGCINSSEVVEHLGEYLEYAGNVKFWAIEMGTNDAWGGGDWNLATYKKNMQTIIDSAKAHGITPVIARIIATDSSKAGWQVIRNSSQATAFTRTATRRAGRRCTTCGPKRSPRCTPRATRRKQTAPNRILLELFLAIPQTALLRKKETFPSPTFIRRAKASSSIQSAIPLTLS